MKEGGAVGDEWVTELNRRCDKYDADLERTIGTTRPTFWEDKVGHSTSMTETVVDAKGFKLTGCGAAFSYSAETGSSMSFDAQTVCELLEHMGHQSYSQMATLGYIGILLQAALHPIVGVKEGRESIIRELEKVDSFVRSCIYPLTDCLGAHKRERTELGSWNDRVIEIIGGSDRGV